jgi:hypothetical protein
MADLFQGQTMTELFQFISAGTAHTFTFGFQPDKVVFNNLTSWAGAAGTVGEFPRVTWYRNQTTTAHAYQDVVVDTAAGASYNFLEAAANGFTVANTTGGAPDYEKLIAGVSQADPCVVTTTANHGYITGEIVRITDLGNSMPVARGMEQIDGKRFKIIVLAVNTFSLQDVITGLDIDSSGYTAWVAGGRVQLETRVIPIYADPFVYDPITYKLTAGTSVMGADSDVFNIEVYKFGEVTDLGDLLV